MRNHIRRSILFGTLTAVKSAVPQTSAVSYRAVYSFQGGGYSQPGPIAEGSSGVFFTAVVAPALVSVTSQGTMATIATFPDNYTVVSYTVAAPNQMLYSSVETFGSGSVFSFSPSTEGEHTYPPQSLFPCPIAGNLPGGNMFGLASTFSGPTWSFATIDVAANMTPLYQFPSGSLPAVPVYATDGNYYGTGATSNTATTTYFYKLTPSGAFTTVATLPFLSYAFPGSGFILQGTDGNFYGIQPTGYGCSKNNQRGAIYQLTPARQFTILHDFGVCNNAVVDSLIEGSDGKFYGIIQGNGLIFSLSKSGDYKEVSRAANAICPCWLLQGSDGIIYGVAQSGGANGAGLIFALDAGLPIPKPRALRLSPQSGG